MRQERVVEWFGKACSAVAAWLPFGLSRVVAPSFVGFAVINGFTFGVDLLILTLLHGVLHWPYAAAVTVGYAIAFGLAFVLNRVFNFRSHEALGKQTALYVVTVAINFGVILQGIGGGLEALGVQYHVARIVAGVCEGVFMYSAMRWVVFARRNREQEPAPASATGGPDATRA